jgi:hypothetical protein
VFLSLDDAIYLRFRRTYLNALTVVSTGTGLHRIRITTRLATNISPLNRCRAINFTTPNSMNVPLSKELGLFTIAAISVIHARRTLFVQNSKFNFRQKRSLHDRQCDQIFSVTWMIVMGDYRLLGIDTTRTRPKSEVVDTARYRKSFLITFKIRHSLIIL